VIKKRGRKGRLKRNTNVGDSFSAKGGEREKTYGAMGWARCLPSGDTIIYQSLRTNQDRERMGGSSVSRTRSMKERW